MLPVAERKKASGGEGADRSVWFSEYTAVLGLRSDRADSTRTGSAAAVALLSGDACLDGALSLVMITGPAVGV